MTRHSFLLGGACLADLLRIEDLRTMGKCWRALPHPTKRELGRRDAIVCFLKPGLPPGRGEAEEGEEEDEQT